MKISSTAPVSLLFLSSIPSKNNQAFAATRGYRSHHHLDDNDTHHQRGIKNDDNTILADDGARLSPRHKKKPGHRMLSPKDGGKGGGGKGDIITPYRAPCDAIMIHKDNSNKDIVFVTNPDHYVQLMHAEDNNEAWCSSVGCLGEQWTAAFFGEQIENGFQLEFASTDFKGDYKMICPFGLTPQIASTECFEAENTLTSPPTMNNIHGPFSRFITGESGCDAYDVTVTCTTDDAELLKDIFKKADKCKSSGARLNSADKFLIQFQNDGLQDGIYVDGLDYELEFLATDSDDLGGCTPSACSGEKWSAYMTGVDIDGGSKYVLSVVDGHNWNAYQFMCPSYDQTPVLADFFCDFDVGSVSAGNFDTRGPGVRDIDFSLSGGCKVVTIEIHCLDSEILTS